MLDQVNATPTPHKRLPWNEGKLTGSKPPLRPKFGTHSLRRTKATLIYRGQEISGPSSSCSGIPRSKARSGTSASRSTMPWQ